MLRCAPPLILFPYTTLFRSIRKRSLLALVVIAGLLEVQQVLDVIFHDGAARGRLDRALIAAVFALNGARYVEPAQLLDGVITHAVLEDVAPGIGKGPEALAHVRAHRRALGPRRALPLAALHFSAHLRVHFLERNVADSLLCHGLSSPAAFGRSLESGCIEVCLFGDRLARPTDGPRPLRT